MLQNITVSNDVLFAGSLDGVVYALSTFDGEELWSFDTAISVVGPNGAVGNGGTIDSVGPIPVGDSLYINSGYSFFGAANQYFGGPGNALFSFALQ